MITKRLKVCTYRHFKSRENNLHYHTRYGIKYYAISLRYIYEVLLQTKHVAYVEEGPYIVLHIITKLGIMDSVDI